MISVVDSRRSRLAIGVCVAIAVGVLCWQASLFDARALLASASTADPLAVAVGLALSVAAVVNRGLHYRSAYRTVDLEVAAPAMIRTTASGYAANKVVRTAGASGLAVFLVDGRRRGFASSSVVTACAVAALGSFVALGVLLVSSVILLAVTGGLSVWWAAAVGAFVFQAALVALAIRSLVVRGRGVERAESIVVSLLDRWQHRRGSVDPDRTSTSSRARLHDAIGQFHDTWVRCRTNPEWAARVLVHALLSKALGASMLAAAVHAFDLDTGASTVVVLYATALAASFVSIVPGGVGVVEASTTALLVTHGVPAPTAALVVLLFRLFDLGFPVAVGVAFGAAGLGTRTDHAATNSPELDLIAPPAVPALARAADDRRATDALAA